MLVNELPVYFVPGMKLRLQDAKIKKVESLTLKCSEVIGGNKLFLLYGY